MSKNHKIRVAGMHCENYRIVQISGAVVLDVLHGGYVVEAQVGDYISVKQAQDLADRRNVEVTVYPAD